MLWTFVETFRNFVFLFMILFWICSQSLLFTTSIKVLLQHRIFQFFITYSSYISIINGASCQRVWFFLRGGWKDGNKKNFLKFSLLFCSVLLELLYLGILLSRLILCSCLHLECSLHRIKFLFPWYRSKYYSNICLHREWIRKNNPVNLTAYRKNMFFNT